MSNKTTITEPERLALTVNDVAAALGISTRHIWKLVASGRFPRPLALGRSKRWLRSAVEEHLAGLQRAAAGAK